MTYFLLNVKCRVDKFYNRIKVNLHPCHHDHNSHHHCFPQNIKFVSAFLQSYRKTYSGWDLQRPSSPTSYSRLLTPPHSDQVAQNSVQLSLSISENRNPTASPATCSTCLTTVMMKTFSFYLVRISPCSSLCPLPVLLPLCTSENSLTPSFYISPVVCPHTGEPQTGYSTSYLISQELSMAQDLLRSNCWLSYC